MTESDEAYFKRQKEWLDDDLPTPRSPLAVVTHGLSSHLSENSPTPWAPMNAVVSAHSPNAQRAQSDPQYKPETNPRQLPGGYHVKEGSIHRGLYGRWVMTGRAYYYDESTNVRYVEYPIHRLTKYKYDLLVFNDRFWVYLCSTAWKEGQIQEVVKRLNTRQFTWALIHAETGFVIEEGTLGRYGFYGAEPGGR